MEDEKRASITNPEKSQKAKHGWRKYHANYMRGIRKRERNNMNKTKELVKDLKEVLDSYTYLDPGYWKQVMSSIGAGKNAIIPETLPDDKRGCIFLTIPKNYKVSEGDNDVDITSLTVYLDASSKSGTEDSPNIKCILVYRDPITNKVQTPTFGPIRLEMPEDPNGFIDLLISSFADSGVEIIKPGENDELESEEEIEEPEELEEPEEEIEEESEQPEENPEELEEPEEKIEEEPEE